MLAKVLFEVAVKLQKETGVHIKFINLSGGVGIPYKPDQEPNDIRAIGDAVYTKKYWYLQVWEMSQSIQRWDVS